MKLLTTADAPHVVAAQLWWHDDVMSAAQGLRWQPDCVENHQVHPLTHAADDGAMIDAKEGVAVVEAVPMTAIAALVGGAVSAWPVVLYS